MNIIIMLSGILSILSGATLFKKDQTIYLAIGVVIGLLANVIFWFGISLYKNGSINEFNFELNPKIQKINEVKTNIKSK